LKIQVAFENFEIHGNGVIHFDENLAGKTAHGDILLFELEIIFFSCIKNVIWIGEISCFARELPQSNAITISDKMAYVN
jgi:hypothetical protein